MPKGKDLSVEGNIQKATALYRAAARKGIHISNSDILYDLTPAKLEYVGHLISILSEGFIIDVKKRTIKDENTNHEYTKIEISSKPPQIPSSKGLSDISSFTEPLPYNTSQIFGSEEVPEVNELKSPFDMERIFDVESPKDVLDLLNYFHDRRTEKK